MRQNLPVNVYEDGNESRDFVYVDDAADVFVNALRFKTSPVLVNVGSGCPTTLVDLAETLRNAWGSSSPLTTSGDYRIGDIRHNWSDNHRLKEYIPDWQPRSLSDGLKEFVEWAKTQTEFTDASELATNELIARDLGRTAQ
jgi:dTDP-L-rhamnose 4-epimerase